MSSQQVRHLLFGIFICLVYVVNAKNNNTRNHLVFDCSFENWRDIDKWEKEICRPGALTLTTETVRKGKAAVRFELRKSDAGQCTDFVRSELRLPDEKDNERWYGFSNYFPQDFVADPLAEIVAQWHEIPDWDLGESWRSPPISLGVQNDRFYVKILWAAAAVNTNKNIDGEKKEILGNVEKGKWIDWVFHIKYSCQSDGVVEIWKNKEKLLEYYGPNSFNDKHFPYFKIGIYKWGWNGWAAYSPEDERVLYYDEVKIGDKYADIKTVAAD